MSDHREIEEGFWATWRIRFLPIVITLGAVAAFWLIFDAAWAMSPWSGPARTVTKVVRVVDTVWATPKLGPGGESARLVAGMCHFDLRNVARTQADSLRIYHGQRDMDKGNMSCAEWMIGNGEQLP